MPFFKKNRNFKKIIKQLALLNVCSYNNIIKQTFGGIKMKKNTLEEPVHPFTFLQKKFFLSNTTNELEFLPQMPESQIILFLNQAFTKKKKIILQINQLKNQSQLTEVTGFIRYTPFKRPQIVLENTLLHMTYLIQPSDIRHIRLS